MKDKIFARTFLGMFAIFASTLFFCGCPLKVTVECDKNDALSVNFSSQLGEAFVESLAQIQQISSENAQNSPNLNEISKKIQTELNANSFKNASVNFGKNALTAAAQVPNTKALPKEFINIQKAAGGKKTLTLTLSPQSLAASVLKENSAAKTMADILMAPIISGEEMSLQEYKDLLNEIYGPRLASEILAGDLTVEFVDKASGKKQTQKVPVADLLLAHNGRKFVFDY